ncbi:MAG: leucine-rich repeat protein, partial [Paludibacteraceae bacterium]|nr:leucine-rich repeat protein [Paludibacteraceae bacterium]
CQQLRYIDIPDNVTDIHEWAFSNCQQMDSLRMGKSVNYIGDAAFCGCMSLRVIDCYLPAPCYVGSQALDTGYGMYYGCNTTLIVDKGKGVLFSVADQWQDLYIIEREYDIPTSIDDVSVRDIHTYKKLLRNGQLHILRDNKTYTIMGQEM